MENRKFEDFQGFWEEVTEKKKNNPTRDVNIRDSNINESVGKTIRTSENITADEEKRNIDRLLLMDIIYQMRELSEEVKSLNEQIAAIKTPNVTEPQGAVAMSSGTSPPNVVQMPQSMTGQAQNISQMPYYAEQTMPNMGVMPNQAQMQMPNGMAAMQFTVPQQVVVGQTMTETPQAQTELQEKKEPKKKNKAVSIITNIMFYVLIIALVFGAFLIRSSQNGKPFMISGYSAMTVLTGSMESVYPQGSLIVTKATDTNTLQIGDDITYMTGESSSITHRIIGITENYMETGRRGFETKGVMNTEADKEIVAAGNVVGKVVFCSKTLGVIAKFINHNWPLILFAAVVLAALMAFLKWNAGRTDEEDTESEKPKKKKNKKQAEK